MLAVFNTFLVWTMFILMVVFVSGGKTHTKQRRIIKLPKINLPKIVFVSAASMGVSAIAECGKQEINPAISSLAYVDPHNASALMNISEKVADASTTIDERGTAKDNVEKLEDTTEKIKETQDIDHEEMSYEAEPDYDLEKESTSRILMFSSEDSFKLPVQSEDHEDSVEDSIVDIESSGRWEDNVNSETAVVEFDRDVFYSDVIPMAVSTDTL